MINRRQATCEQADRQQEVLQVASRGRVQDLANFLGLDPEVVADVLVDAVGQDPQLREVPELHHAA